MIVASLNPPFVAPSVASPRTRGPRCPRGEHWTCLRVRDGAESARERSRHLKMDAPSGMGNA